MMSAKKIISVLLIAGLGIIVVRIGLKRYSTYQYIKATEPIIITEPEYIISPESLKYTLKFDPIRDFDSYDKAVESYTKAIEIEPRNVLAYLRRAQVYNSLEENEKAIADLNKSIAIDPEQVYPYYERGLVKFGSTKYTYEQAIEDWSKAIALKTQQEQNKSQLRRKTIYEFDNSLLEWYHQELISLNSFPDLHNLYELRARAYLELKQYDKAVADANEAVSLQPEDASKYHFRAYVYREAKQYDRAVANSNRAIELLPEYTHAYKGRAHTYTKLKQYDLAIADYTKALSHYSEYSSFGSNNSDYATAYVSRANVYRELKQYDNAIADYDNALKVYSEFAYAYHNRGDFYQELGNIDQAKQDWEKAASLYQQQNNTEQYQIIQQQLQQW